MAQSSQSPDPNQHQGFVWSGALNWDNSVNGGANEGVFVIPAKIVVPSSVFHNPVADWISSLLTIGPFYAGLPLKNVPLPFCNWNVKKLWGRPLFEKCLVYLSICPLVTGSRGLFLQGLVASDICMSQRQKNLFWAWLGYLGLSYLWLSRWQILYNPFRLLLSNIRPGLLLTSSSDWNF